MTDRELLELAAKAAGITYISFDDALGLITEWSDEDNCPSWWWNPLNDDGDALRLAVKLEIDLQHNWGSVIAIYARNKDIRDWGSVIAIYARNKDIREGLPQHYLPEDESEERLKATRRAIVRAAAEIGKDM